MKLLTGKERGKKKELIIIPLKEMVVFPELTTHFFVGRASSVKAVEKVMEDDRIVFLGTQIGTSSDVVEADIHKTGCISKIIQVLKLPDGTYRVLVQGVARANIVSFISSEPVMTVAVREIEEDMKIEGDVAYMMKTVLESFARYQRMSKKIPQEISAAIEMADNPERLTDLVAANMPFKTEVKLELLGLQGASKRLSELAVAIEAENELILLQKNISNRVKKKMEKNQREYFLREQLTEINKELGKEEADPTGGEEISKMLANLDLADEVRSKAERELKRLIRLQPMSPEAGVLRTYLEWITDLPWNKHTEDNRDIELAAKVLDEDHYDMKAAKERILDFIAVRQLMPKTRGPILCFAGPPGTGKTSLGRSVARALSRQFVRISLGGVRDEAEIRGHRKTYVGALPGKILQSMKKAGSCNPVFLLDEIDKMSSDFRGDPASALLEVLDPEQNHTFTDHYLEVPFDLSEVMFITTANSIHNIPYALRDRMEVIEIPGYTVYEKTAIAKGFIIPKQIRENGLDGTDISFKSEAIKEIIEKYTMEAGVRNLERQIANVIRKIARKAVKEHEKSSEKKEVVTKTDIHEYLGTIKVKGKDIDPITLPGMANGLAWTELGGTMIPVEVALLPGKGQLLLTGNLGDVMKESAQAAFSFIKSHCTQLGLASDFYTKYDIHLHVPEGAIPKDGPSAGITMTAALVSAFLKTALKPGIAMTGEITLTGRLIAIGGVKEKVLAAHRYGMTTVLLPEGNDSDRADLPEEIISSVSFIHFENVLDALKALFPAGTFTKKTGKSKAVPKKE